jgi:hypothetical protein
MNSAGRYIPNGEDNAGLHEKIQIDGSIPSYFTQESDGRAGLSFVSILPFRKRAIVRDLIQ